MDKNTAQIVAQARALRALCSELAHGAAREAFIARVDDEIATLTEERLRLVVVALDRDEPTATFAADLLGGTPAPDVLLACATTRSVTGAVDSATVSQRALPASARAAGIDQVHVVLDPARVFDSPLLFGRLLEACDVVVLAGRATTPGDELVGALRRLADAARHALRLGGDGPDALAARLEGAFARRRAARGSPPWRSRSTPSHAPRRSATARSGGSP
jgi:hypothetical protein